MYREHSTSQLLTRSGVEGTSKSLTLNSNGYTRPSTDKPLAEEILDRTVAG